MKDSGAGRASVQQFPEIEAPAAEEGVGEDLVAAPQQDRFEWAWLLWDRRHLLRRLTVYGLVAATVIALLMPNRYESTTQLMPPDSQSGTGLAMLAAMAGKGEGALGGSALGGLAGDLLGLKSSGALFMEVVRSRTVEDRLIQRFDLRRVYGVRYWEDARKILNKYTQISEDRKSGVITIQVTDRDPHRAAQMAQAYVEELDRLVAEVSTSAARRERIFIEQRLKTVKQDMDKASQEFSEYASKNAAIDIKEQGKAMVQSAAILQGQLIAAQSELQALEQIYTDSNVRVRSLRARVDELRLQLNKLGGDSASLNSTTDSSSNSTGSVSGELYPSIRKLPLLGVRWADLYRETKIQETVYELLTQQYEIAKIQEAKEIPSVKVLDPANVPEKKASPSRTLIVLLGTLLALVGGIVWILGNGIWQEVDPDDPKKQLADEIILKVREGTSRWATDGRRIFTKVLRKPDVHSSGESD